MGVSNCGKGCIKPWDVLSNLPQYHYFCPSYSTIILATALQTTVICLLLLPSSSKSVWIARCADWLGAHAYAFPFSCQMEINKYPLKRKKKEIMNVHLGHSWGWEKIGLQTPETWLTSLSIQLFFLSTSACINFSGSITLSIVFTLRLFNTFILTEGTQKGHSSYITLE